MKKFILSITAVCAAFTMNAQNIFSDDFEQVPTSGSNWQIFNNDADTFNFGFADFTDPMAPAHLQPLSISAISESYYWDGTTGTALSPDNLFISPVIDLSTASGTISVSWDVASGEDAASPYAAEHYAVYVVTDVNMVATATPVYTETLADGGVVYSRMADISALAGSSTAYIVVRHFMTTDMNYIVFDNFSVDQVLGINEGVIKTSVYPNPANDVLNIVANEQIENVTIVTLAGNVAANSATSSVDVSGLTPGMYIYEVSTASGNVSRGTFMKK